MRVIGFFLILIIPFLFTKCGPKGQPLQSDSSSFGISSEEEKTIPQLVEPPSGDEVKEFKAPVLEEDCQGGYLLEGSNESRGKIAVNDFDTCTLKFPEVKNRVCIATGAAHSFGVRTSAFPTDFLEINKLGSEYLQLELIQYICMPMDNEGVEGSGENS